MIDIREHIYHDDPRQGHPDVRTCLPGVSYFFLGNGLVQAAVQLAPEGEGSPYGLLLQDAERLATKRDALTFDPSSGLARTMLSLRLDGSELNEQPPTVRARWTRSQGVAAVAVTWQTAEVAVEERFFCPDRTCAHVLREIRLANLCPRAAGVTVATGVRDLSVSRRVQLDALGRGSIVLRYALTADRRGVALETIAETQISEEATRHFAEQTTLSTGSPLLDHLFSTAADQLSAVVSRGGAVDAGIWQYLREWVRDHAFMAYGLLLGGHHAQARTMLERLIRDFIAEDGSALDSSEKREPLEAELDQNGILLAILREHYRWTGDDSLVRDHWEKLARMAEFPLAAVFRHPASGLLCNARDFWERHGAHGIEPGMELAHHVFVVLGLEAAAWLGGRLGHGEHATRWAAGAARLRRAMLEDPVYGFVDHGRLIKRRHLDGRVMERIHPKPEAMLPDGVPLAAGGDHLLNPDSAAALAVAWGLLDPRTTLARRTMDDLEELWNQGWTMGGYGRYHMSSEPDSRGPWPFVGLYMARAYLELERYDRVWRVLEWFERIPGWLSGAWFEMLGPRVAPPYAQVGIVPWAWAEMIIFGVHHLIGCRPDEASFLLRPRLLPGLTEVCCSLDLRGHRVTVRLRREAGRREPAMETALTALATEGDSFRFELPRRDVTLDVALPEF